MKAVIISNGIITDYNFSKKQCESCFVICADGAINHCINMGVDPDVWVGDMDSCTLDENQFKNATRGCEIIKLNKEKDVTDTEYCCNYAVKNGYDDIIILGATGTRLDHTIANIHMLSKLNSSGVKAAIVDSNNIMYVANKHNVINKGDFDYVSVLPISECLTGVSNTGLYYCQNNDILDKYSSKGVSNKMVDDTATIDITNGDALIILSKD